MVAGSPAASPATALGTAPTGAAPAEVVVAEATRGDAVAAAVAAPVETVLPVPTTTSPRARKRKRANIRRPGM